MKRDDGTLVVVSDFSANGPTRGSLDPVLGICGEVLQPRKEADPAPEPYFSLPPNLLPKRTAPKPPPPPPPPKPPPKPQAPKRRHVKSLLTEKREQMAIERQQRREQREQRHNMRLDLWKSYGENSPQLGQHEYFVGVYQSTPGEFVVTPCEHWHFQVDTAVWCKTFPADRPPTHVVVASTRTSRVVRTLTKIA